MLKFHPFNIRFDDKKRKKKGKQKSSSPFHIRVYFIPLRLPVTCRMLREREKEGEMFLSRSTRPRFFLILAVDWSRAISRSLGTWWIFRDTSSVIPVYTSRPIHRPQFSRLGEAAKQQPCCNSRARLAPVVVFSSRVNAPPRNFLCPIKSLFLMHFKRHYDQTAVSPHLPSLHLIRPVGE